ncbi:hypothetical protein [Streptosporangium sp. H16]|uniref:hypothetical protein n=1 Tax=Streptosporangium sp. H16 TaxID=3444184 RepID=UPI003F7A8691
MGCADCGHAPYAHGCPGQRVDHEYAQPSGALMAERLDARRRLGLGRTLPAFEPAQPTLVPAPRQAAPEATPTRARPTGRTDTRRPTMPTARPPRPVETRESRAVRLALARDSLARRRARVAARTRERSAPPLNTGREPTTLPLLTLLPDPPDHQHQILRPEFAVALGRNHSPDTPPLRQHQPYRWEAAA